MRQKRWIPMALFIASSTACFHQVVQTGRAPSATVVDKPFVSTWIFGIVAAPEIDVRKECPSGAAVIETEQSFVNGLVAVVTIGIYTPQHVRITCASSSASLPARSTDQRIPVDATAAEASAILGRAVAKSTETGSAVVVYFQAYANAGESK